MKDEGETCLNSIHADPWREVELKPKNKSSFKKRKHPREFVLVNYSDENTSTSGSSSESSTLSENNKNNDPDNIVSSDHEENQIEIDSFEKGINGVVDLTNVVSEKPNDVRDVYIDLTAPHLYPKGKACLPWSDDESEDEFLTEGDALIRNDELPDLHDELFNGMEQKKLPPKNLLNESRLPSFSGIHDDIPQEILWESLMGALESCETNVQLFSLCSEMQPKLPRMKKRSENVPFDIQTEYIDASAVATLPPDAPKNVHPIWTLGDGNCLCRSLSRAFYGTDAHHLEIRVRIIVEGVLNKSSYLDHELLRRGATLVRIDEELQVTLAKYSDYYTYGQIITEDTVDYMYCREMHECCKKNTYMGLWQMAQAATVLGCPVVSVYPQIENDVMRRDFHRVFLPVVQPKTNDPINIMWTSA